MNQNQNNQNNNGQQNSSPTQEKTEAEEKNPKTARIQLIKELEKERGNTHIICYIVSTRQNVPYQMADDAVRIVYDHLKELKEKENNLKIDLFLHSFGGVGVVPWKLVNVIREFTKDFEALIPYKAYSAATLTALGANKIWMHPMGELGPIDPKVGNEFNPVNPQGHPVGINVEDVVSYISLIKEHVGIKHEDELVQAFNILAQKIHPLALGNVHRFYSQSRMMAKKLLRLHMSAEEEHKIEEIVETLTSKLFFHGHPINRKEAKSLNLKVENPPEKVEKLMWQLYEEYEKELEIKKPFNPQELLNSSGENSIELYKIKGAYVESKIDTDVFVSELKIIRPPAPPTAPIPIQIQAQTGAVVIPLKTGWEKE